MYRSHAQPHSHTYTHSLADIHTCSTVTVHVLTYHSYPQGVTLHRNPWLGEAVSSVVQGWRQLWPSWHCKLSMWKKEVQSDSRDLQSKVVSPSQGFLRRVTPQGGGCQAKTRADGVQKAGSLHWEWLPYNSRFSSGLSSPWAGFNWMKLQRGEARWCGPQTVEWGPFPTILWWGLILRLPGPEILILQRAKSVCLGLWMLYQEEELYFLFLVRIEARAQSPQCNWFLCYFICKRVLVLCCKTSQC